MKSSRILEMEQYIIQQGNVTMTELQNHFGISMNTVRRDIVQLLEHGTVAKVYGGVTARQKVPVLTPYEERMLHDETAKIAIGRKAAELVSDRDIIFIDSGTTTLQIIDFLHDKKDLTVITNNLEVINRAVPFENITVIALPGQLRRKTNSFTGEETVRLLHRYNIRLAFVAATGISVHGVTNSSPLEYEIKKCAVENSEHAVLMVTSEKFGSTGLMSFAQTADFKAIVTEKEPDAEMLSKLAEEGTTLMVADSI